MSAAGEPSRSPSTCLVLLLRLKERGLALGTTTITVAELIKRG